MSGVGIWSIHDLSSVTKYRSEHSTQPPPLLPAGSIDLPGKRKGFDITSYFQAFVLILNETKI